MRTETSSAKYLGMHRTKYKAMINRTHYTPREFDRIIHHIGNFIPEDRSAAYFVRTMLERFKQQRERYVA